MADIYLHSKLSEEVVSHLSNDIDLKTVFLGAQGPDPLYYVFFGKDASDYRYYADRMHDTNTRMLLSNMVRYVKKHTTVETYSFLVGFLCHYALDVKIHPYVYNHVGVYDKTDPDTHKYQGLHLRFERAIDAQMIEEEHSIKAHKYSLTKKYFPLTKASDDIAAIMGYTLKQTYGKDNGDVMYQTGAKKMYRNVKFIITDKFGIKKQIYKFIDLFNKGTDLFFKDLSFYKHLDDYDYLNKKNRTWNHPITNEEFTYSVEDLYDQALQFALEMIRTITPYIFEDKTVDLDTVFPNLSFNSGVECDHQSKMKYFTSYLEKGN